MVDFIPNERATPIRYPSTANLMIDSADRTSFYSSPWNFQISKNNSIMNGFFTRIGTTEVVLEWCEPNIYADGSNNTLVLDISGNTGAVSNYPIVLQEGFYTVAEALNQIVNEINDLSGTTGSTFQIAQQFGETFIVGSSVPLGEIGVSMGGETGLSVRLDITPTGLAPSMAIGVCVDLRRYRYLDFVSSQLTYNQDLKDNSTAPFARDVLCRWYMAWDNPPTLDAYGYPILMGYTTFVVRRLYNPPKQIKWDARQPLGNMAFEVYGNDGKLLPPPAILYDKSNWLMTLQFSEV